MKEEEIWKGRSKVYDMLGWTRRKEYISKILQACNLKSYYDACDVGTGTGVVAYALSKYCKSVHGIDISSDMLEQAKKHHNADNITYMKMDAENMDFPNWRFHVVTARMVFHHIVRPIIAIHNCCDILKPGGKLIISEGVPPVGVKSFHERFLKKKEDRQVFSVDDLVQFFEKSKFENIDFEIHKMPDVSIRNWLDNSGLPKEKQEELYKIRLDSPMYSQKAENMRISNGDILTDWYFAIVSGVKPSD